MRTSASVASGSRVDSSSTVSGREALKSAASSSWASGVTGDHHRREGGRLSQTDGAPLGQLEQGEEHGEEIGDGGARAQRVEPAEFLPFLEQRLDAPGGGLDIERAGHHAVEHGDGYRRDDPLDGL